MSNTPCVHGWKIVRRIGSGHFGAVYEIEKETSGNFSAAVEHSAMKLISIPPSQGDLESLQADYGDDATVTTLLRSQVDDIAKEFEVMSKLKGHSNIVSFEDYEIVQQDNGMGWDVLIRMELLTSLSLYTKGRTMEESEIIRLAIDMCRALELCEKHDIIHRDIKPQNIFVNKDGNFKLGDFGIARVSEHMTASTVAGTYTYMAPEVYQNKENYDKRVDIYSLGLVLYWLLNERRDPFLPLPPATFTNKEKDAAFQKRIIGEPLPSPAHGSPALQAVVLRACAFKREDRFANAAEMRKALESLSAGEEKPAREEKPVEAAEPSVPAKHTDIPTEEDSSRDETVDGRGSVSKKTNSSAGKLDESTISAFHRSKGETVYDAKTVYDGKSKQPGPEQEEKKADSGKQPKKSKTPLLIAAACVVAVLAVWMTGHHSSNVQNEETSTSSATTTVASGTCGDNVTWTLDDEGTLTISGSGEMEDYPDLSMASWYDQYQNIHSIVIENGVTTIGDNAFAFFSNLTSVTISDSVTSIGIYAFMYCPSLTTITIPDSVSYISYSAFSDCYSLKDVYYSGSESDRDKITVGSITIDDDEHYGNDYLFNATWHYNS